MVFYNRQHGNLELILSLQVFESWPVHWRPKKKKAPNIWIPCNSFSKWLLLPFCGCCPTLHCRALVSHELLICSPALRARPGSLAVLHAHCATPWSPVCAPLTPTLTVSPAWRLAQQWLCAQMRIPCTLLLLSLNPDSCSPQPDVSPTVVLMGCHCWTGFWSLLDLLISPS